MGGNYQVIETDREPMIFEMQGNLIVTSEMEGLEIDDVIDRTLQTRNPYRMHTQGQNIILEVNQEELLKIKVNIVPINDDMIKEKIEYNGNNELIKWIINQNPFRKNKSIQTIKKTITNEILDSMI